jgi:hypothetical protein
MPFGRPLETFLGMFSVEPNWRVHRKGMALTQGREEVAILELEAGNN